MIKNYLKGVIGDEMNVMLSAAAMNFKRMMNRWSKGLAFLSKILTLELSLFSEFFSGKVEGDFLRAD